MSELQYSQEYLGLFLEELRQFFPDELIAKRCNSKRPIQKPKTNIFAGCDLARFGGDEITYELLHKLENNHIQQIENIVKTMQTTTETERQIVDLTKVWNIKQIGIDAGAGTLGVSIYDHLLENKLTKKKMIAMNNRQVALDRDGKKLQRLMKEDFYDNLLSLMEKGQIDLLDDENLRLSLRSIQWALNEKSLVTKVHIFGNYDHIADGIAYAAYLAKKAKINKLAIHSI